MGQIGILNVGAGDTKLTFDRNNPAECIRSARIVADMLRRGYALLIKIGDEYQRVHEFREDTCEYIIADFDPIIAVREETTSHEPIASPGTTEPPTAPGAGARTEEKPLATPAIAGGRRRGRQRAVDARTTDGIAVSRSAGG